jgi:hypothetical protein
LHTPKTRRRGRHEHRLHRCGKFIEIQGTAEREPFTREQMNEMLALAEKGINDCFRSSAWRWREGMSEKQFEGKICDRHRCDRGIGKAIAQELAKRGAMSRSIIRRARKRREVESRDRSRMA